MHYSFINNNNSNNNNKIIIDNRDIDPIIYFVQLKKLNHRISYLCYL